VNERELVRRLQAKAGRAPGLALGIGDDCAIYRPGAGQELVFTTDLFIEDVHFLRVSTPAEQAGARALARSLSDIAAMGASPRFCLVSLALPSWVNRKWFDGFYRGLLKLARKYKMALAGGDMSHAAKLTCDVMVCGSVAKGKALRRSGAKPGDLIYVSGPLGGWKHKKQPEPRIELGRKLAGKASAAIDISDGISLDLYRLCAASNVAAKIDRVPPLLPGATAKQALHDGEDYELLYTASPKVSVPGFKIGSIVRGRAGSVSYMGRPLALKGYDHFAGNCS
jgi:thiamine-monophosphate kinase